MKTNYAPPSAGSAKTASRFGIFTGHLASFALVAAAGLSSCTTTPIDRQTLPEILKSQFAPCIPREGTVELTFQHKRSIKASEVTLDFVADSSQKLRAELTNPLGQTMLGITLDPPGRKLAFSGRSAKGLKEQVTVDDKGFLEVDGNFTGIKLSELICGLGGVWPEPWLNKLTTFQVISDKGQKSARLVAEDERRKIKLTLPLTGEMPRRCADISISYALGLHREKVAMCLHPNKGLGSLSRSKPDQSLRWAIIMD